MDLSTTYLGLKLRTPLVPAASPLSENIDSIKRMEDANASAVVLYSLFEEQLKMESKEINNDILNYYPKLNDYKSGPAEYMEHVRKAKEAVDIPIIGSLNGATLGGWTNYAQQIEQAGADALELNIYYIPTDIEMSGANVEQRYLSIVEAVKLVVSIPVAVKLSPFFSNMANMTKRLVDAGADGLVLFNRFYQPDFDLENLTVQPHLLLSTPQALRLPLRWIAILHGRIETSLAATGGIHSAYDVIKMLMAGADVTMLCSVLLRNGIDHIQKIEEYLITWMRECQYESLKRIKGSMSQINCKEPGAYERAQYIKSLTFFQQDNNIYS